MANAGGIALILPVSMCNGDYGDSSKSWMIKLCALVLLNCTELSSSVTALGGFIERQFQL